VTRATSPRTGLNAAPGNCQVVSAPDSKRGRLVVLLLAVCALILRSQAFSCLIGSCPAQSPRARRHRSDRADLGWLARRRRQRCPDNRGGTPAAGSSAPPRLQRPGDLPDLVALRAGEPPRPSHRRPGGEPGAPPPLAPIMMPSLLPGRRRRPLSSALSETVEKSIDLLPDHRDIRRALLAVLRTAAGRDEMGASSVDRRASLWVPKTYATRRYS
jgi:hypothetical protein